MSIRWSFYRYCAHLKILHNVAMHRSILILFRIAKRTEILYFGEYFPGISGVPKSIQIWGDATMTILLFFVGRQPLPHT